MEFLGKITEGILQSRHCLLGRQCVTAVGALRMPSLNSGISGHTASNTILSVFMILYFCGTDALPADGHVRSA